MRAAMSLLSTSEMVCSSRVFVSCNASSSWCERASSAFRFLIVALELASPPPPPPDADGPDVASDSTSSRSSNSVSTLARIDDSHSACLCSRVARSSATSASSAAVSPPPPPPPPPPTPESEGMFAAVGTGVVATTPATGKSPMVGAASRAAKISAADAPAGSTSDWMRTSTMIEPAA
eukprot:Amastigsp_a509091_361.p3 type:complete len:178 gc:universal Amastigsp_a509091_361:1665-1132(-)